MASDQAYQNAKKKIIEAQQSEATKLDFNNMNLTKLPELLGQLTQLQVLDLSNNQLTTLPESLGQLTQLQVLDLSNNQLA